MRRNTVFTADAANTEFASCAKPRTSDKYLATVSIYGTFGSGTVTLFMSPDNGTTKIALIDDLTGVAFSLTAARCFDIEMGTGDGSAGTSEIKLYATLAGATNPSLNITVHDNL